MAIRPRIFSGAEHVVMMLMNGGNLLMTNFVFLSMLSKLGHP